MTAFMFGLDVLWLILFGVLWSRISRLSGEVHFLRNLLDQALHRLRAMESVRQEPPETSPVEPAAPDTTAATVRTPPPLPIAPPPRPAYDGSQTPPPLPLAPQITAPYRVDPNRATEATAPAPDIGKAPAETETARNLRLEQFVGAKLFAWLGGLALFFAAALGLKYSFDHNLLPPWVRAVAGAVLGIGLLVGGTVMNRRRYPQTATTLWATGIVILYAVTFACRSLYAFPMFTTPVTFAVMVLITALAFGLAVSFETQVVAVLGMLGGFLTPVLVSSGQDQALALFSYIAVLDVGLIAVAWRRRWDHLTLLAAVGTVVMQLGWYTTSFQPTKIDITQMHLALFPLLFTAALSWAHRAGWANRALTLAAILPSVVTLGLTFFLAGSQDGVSAQPWLWVPALFVAEAALCWIGWIRSDARWAEPLGGSLTFLILSAWTMARMTQGTMWWGLGMMLAFALMHAATPVAWRRFRSQEKTPMSRWNQIAPALAILLALLVVIRELPVGPEFWILILLLDAIAVGVALTAGGLLGLMAVLVLSMGSAALWMRTPTLAATDLAESLFVIGAFVLFFVATSTWLIRRSTRTPSAFEPDLLRWMPALSALLPYTLLWMVIGRLNPVNPSPVFAMSLGLSGVLLVLHRWQRIPSLPYLALAGHALVQAIWIATAPRDSSPVHAVAWIGASFLLFLANPILLRTPLDTGRTAWATSALAGPLQLILLHWVIRKAWDPAFPGLIPLPFLAATALVFFWVQKRNTAEAEGRLAALAWLGGSCLFLVTAIFPIEFRNQWLTIAWALEGAALCALFHRLPHPGLRLTGIGLLTIVFVRLFSHPLLFGNAPRPDSAWNWILYTYLAVIGCLFVAAYLLAPPRDLVMGSRVPPFLMTAGTALGFLLLNLEIATVFGTGATLTWDFTGNFARDLAYSVGWSLFAFGLLVAGFVAHNRFTRYAGLALLGLTLVKVFLHDLASLGSLHRIGAFAAVAVVAIVASFLYQRFQGKELEG
jgi:uncharacterized membrane protein